MKYNAGNRGVGLNVLRHIKDAELVEKSWQSIRKEKDGISIGRNLRNGWLIRSRDLK